MSAMRHNAGERFSLASGPALGGMTKLGAAIRPRWQLFFFLATLVKKQYCQKTCRSYPGQADKSDK
jgi:hypothetical protein